MKYKILFNYGSNGHSFEDDEFETVEKAVKHALGLGYHTDFLIVSIVDWEAIQRCPYPDCPKVKYKDCPVHGEQSNTPTPNS